jgi:hypothetical protein
MPQQVDAELPGIIDVTKLVDEQRIAAFTIRPDERTARAGGASAEAADLTRFRQDLKRQRLEAKIIARIEEDRTIRDGDDLRHECA